MSKTRSIHHIVFATKRREMTITEKYKRELYAYIMGIIKNKRCFLIRINGIANHIHILVDINPSIALADLVKDVKQWSSRWMRENPKFPQFDYWGEGYYAVSVGTNEVETCRQYIINQEKHHYTDNLLVEMKLMAEKNGLNWYDDDWV